MVLKHMAEKSVVNTLRRLCQKPARPDAYPPLKCSFGATVCDAFSLSALLSVARKEPKSHLGQDHRRPVQWHTHAAPRRRPQEARRRRWGTIGG